MMMLLARTYMQFQIIADILQSRGLLTGDDVTAFSMALHYDAEKFSACLRRAHADYIEVARKAGAAV